MPGAGPASLKSAIPQRAGAAGDVAIVPVHGVLMRHPAFIDTLFGATSTEAIGRALHAAATDPAIKAIVLDVDSPGGVVAGVQELALEVYQANAQKPVVAVATDMMASAAYWISAAADSVWVANDTTRVGSIGIIAKHHDISERERMLGIKTTEIFAGTYKTLGSAHAPLSEEARSALQAQVDYLYSLFVDEVARYRGVSSSTVLGRMADGRIFLGAQAISAGLADGKATLEEIAGRLSVGTLARRRSIAGSAAPAPRVVANALSLEERCQATWREDAEVRAEFGEDFAAFLAWERLVAAGRVINQRK